MSDHLPRLLTASYQGAVAARQAGEPILLVRTSLGKPKFLPPNEQDAMPYIEELAPVGMFHLDGDPFRRRYRHRLHKTGVRRIEARFTELQTEFPGLSLCLLCFEPDPADCHRAIFARWWLEKTGEAIFEVDVPSCPVAFADAGYVEEVRTM